MKKYYVEIWHIEEEYDSPYILQSKWYDTEEEALEFAKQIEYLDASFVKDLMSADFDDAGEMGDIDFEYRLG
jgi:hypothetical protein